MVFIFSCEDAKRDWDNPYDPRSNRSLWTPDSLKIVQKSENEIQLSWLRRGRDFDGFIIDKKIGPGDWLDSVAVLWDSTFLWIDTLDLKDLVLNPYLYKYRIYAYADTNTSLKKIDQFQPTIPGPPGSLSISNITYTHIPKKTLSISWQQSLDLDFHSYNIHHAFSENGTRSLFSSIYDVETTSLDTNQFTVNNENWFWVEIVDTTGQKTLGNAFSIPRDPPPTPSSLDSIHYNNQKFIFKWSKPIENDIDYFKVHQVNINDTSIVTSSAPIESNKTEFEFDTEVDFEGYYLLSTMDVWGNEALSQIRRASSFQKIVKLDTVTENGDDIIIMNLGPTLPLTRTLAGVKASFPVWVQGGKKIFSFTINGVGLVTDQDGSNLRTINGIKPQDISFNRSQSQALFIGSDDDIYLIYLNEDKSVQRITQNQNNEWYSDPEFIDGDSKILFSQRKHLSNNNIGTINIYYMDLDGKNVVQVSDAVDEEKFVMPRLSPAGDQIIYLNKQKGMYELDFPLEKRGSLVQTDGGDPIFPHATPYFRNIRWSPNGEYAIITEKKFNSTYNLYLYKKEGNPKLRLFQSGARYAQWNGNEEIIFKYESSSGFYRKTIDSIFSDDPILLYDSPWVQLQPRQ